MKYIQKPIEDSRRPEYDLTNLRGVVRGKHSRAYNEHLRVVRLSDDVASAFKTEDAVNGASGLSSFEPSGQYWRLAKHSTCGTCSEIVHAAPFNACIP